MSNKPLGASWAGSVAADATAPSAEVAAADSSVSRFDLLRGIRLRKNDPEKEACRICWCWPLRADLDWSLARDDEASELAEAVNDDDDAALAVGRARDRVCSVWSADLEEDPMASLCSVTERVRAGVRLDKAEAENAVQKVIQVLR